MFKLIVLSAFNEKTRFKILNLIFWFNCLQFASCKLQGCCKILLPLLTILFKFFLVLCIIEVYLAKRLSILNVLESKFHVIYWRAYMLIFHTIKKQFMSSLNWPTLWKWEVSGFWWTLKPIEFRCYYHLKKFYLNIAP
jgi:hypothetical protein